MELLLDLIAQFGVKWIENIKARYGRVRLSCFKESPGCDERVSGCNNIRLIVARGYGVA
jgi:hypothetical protein